jgi:hypothetical protein
MPALLEKNLCRPSEGSQQPVYPSSFGSSSVQFAATLDLSALTALIPRANITYQQPGDGRSAQMVNVNNLSPSTDYTPQTFELRNSFRESVQRWKSERDPTALASRMISHSAYQAIINMGWPAVGLILEELQREPDEWFFALSKITGADPIPEESRGYFDEMVDAWLKWGRANGYRF